MTCAVLVYVPISVSLVRLDDLGFVFQHVSALSPKQRLGWMCQHVQSRFSLWIPHQGTLLFCLRNSNPGAVQGHFDDPPVLYQSPFLLRTTDGKFKIVHSPSPDYKSTSRLATAEGVFHICGGYTGSVGVDFARPCCQGSVALALCTWM